MKTINISLPLIKKLSFNKRQKIITASVIVTFGLMYIQQPSFIFILGQSILALAVLTYIVSIWALWEGMSKLKAVVLLILPIFFTVGVAASYFYLPVRWLTRVPVAILFGLSFYSLLLSQNVFSIASTRTIPLYRVASTVSFVFTIFTSFLWLTVAAGYNLPFYWNGVVVFLICLPLVIQELWSIQMDKVSSQIIIYSLILSMIVGEIALALSFWPVGPTIWALFLCATLYILLGIFTDLLRDRLTTRLILGYVGVGVVVFLFSFIATSWTGF